MMREHYASGANYKKYGLAAMDDPIGAVPDVRESEPVRITHSPRFTTGLRQPANIALYC